jgi:hypothetical protein
MLFKLLLFLGVIGYVIYRFGSKLYQIARVVAGVGDVIAKQKEQNQPPKPQYQDKTNNINVYHTDQKQRKDFSDGEYIDYEEVK